MNSTLRHSLDALSGVIRGKDRELRLGLCCMLARGHLLIEDLPGMGKNSAGIVSGPVDGFGLSTNPVYQ